MNHYNVWQLVVAIQQIQSLEGLLEKFCDNGLRDTYIKDPFVATMVRPCLDYCKAQCGQAELTAAMNRLNGILHGNVNAKALTHEELRMQLRELRRDIDHDLPFRRFAYIPPEKGNRHARIAHEWDAIWLAMPDSKPDTLAAADCYALDLNTALVFHAMRISEQGLRTLARKLHVTLTDKSKSIPIEFADWEKLISACRNKIEEARRMAKGPRKEKRLQFYSEAADHCTYMKDIWRNEVSHARKNYNEGEALGVFERVRDFMTFLAKGIAPK